MSIAFTPERWEKLRTFSRAWWAGEARRPMLYVVAPRAPDRPAARLTHRHFLPQHGLDVDPADVVDAMDHHLAGQEYLVDGHPYIWLNYGAGVLAAFTGCHLQYDDNTVWFFPRREVPARDLHLGFETGNRWFRQLCDVAEAASARWRGNVMLGMTDIGGASDVVSSHLTPERMLTDLYDAPEEIERLMWEAHAFWWHLWREVDRRLRPCNPGYSSWTPIYSEEPYYMLQSDFCYMIGPDMFDRFVRPELVASCRQLPNAFYHLDGVGELPHLDSLLAIPELKGIQWVQGAGRGGPMEWLDVYRRILDGGKRLQITGGSLSESLAVIDKLAAEKRPVGRIYLSAWLGRDDRAARAELDAFLKRYGGE
jgi:5-methyltetrahydrofolate--homocysteine methyltransferase